MGVQHWIGIAALCVGSATLACDIEGPNYQFERAVAWEHVQQDDGQFWLLTTVAVLQQDPCGNVFHVGSYQRTAQRRTT